MRILGKVRITTDEGIPFAREKLRTALIHARLRPVYAAQVASYVFQQIRNACPKTLTVILQENGRGIVLQPDDIVGRYSNIPLHNLLSEAEIKKIQTALSKLTLDELLNDLEQQVQDRTAELAHERERSEKLLNNMLPSIIATRMKNGEAIADEHDATVIFADIYGFTSLAKDRDAANIVSILDQVFKKFDEIAEKHGLEKIKTIGDSYMAAAGVPDAKFDHVDRTVLMGLEIAKLMPKLSKELDVDLKIRIGIHTGPLVAGVIGTKKYSYDIWGDTVNVASRMESHGVAGHVQVSDDVRQILGERFKLEERGTINIKNRGKMRAWLVHDIAAT